MFFYTLSTETFFLKINYSGLKCDKILNNSFTVCETCIIVCEPGAQYWPKGALKETKLDHNILMHYVTEYP